jgi:hypothetical protein
MLLDRRNWNWIHVSNFALIRRDDLRSMARLARAPNRNASLANHQVEKNRALDKQGVDEQAAGYAVT